MSSKRFVQDEVAKSLTVTEKAAVESLDLLMVRGKRGRPVPILLTKNTKESMDILVQYNLKKREKGSNTKYVFSRVSDDAGTPYRGSGAVSSRANQADLRKPENIKCTKLREHIASLSQLLCMKKHELGTVSKPYGTQHSNS